MISEYQCMLKKFYESLTLREFFWPLNLVLSCLWLVSYFKTPGGIQYGIPVVNYNI